MEILVQLAIICVWGGVVWVHGRRLLRWSRPIHASTPPPLAWRGMLARIWWWLGRREFWNSLAADLLRSIELTLLVMLIAWGSFW